MARLIFLDGGKEFLLLRSLLRGEDGGFRGKCQGQFRQITEKRIFLFPGPGTDAQFAAEIGSILEDAGNRVILQQWDFANRNFVEGMHAALEIGARVIALLSPAYFAQRPTWARNSKSIVASATGYCLRMIQAKFTRRRGARAG